MCNTNPAEENQRRKLQSFVEKKAEVPKRPWGRSFGRKRHTNVSAVLSIFVEPIMAMQARAHNESRQATQARCTLYNAQDDIRPISGDIHPLAHTAQPQPRAAHD